MIPPEIPALPANAKIPPLESDKLCNAPIVAPPPATNVSEFIVPEAANVCAATNRTFAFAVAKSATVSVATVSGLKIAVPESAVANEIPSPVSDVSTIAHGKIPFVTAPTPPVCPAKLHAVLVIVATFAPATVPNEVPRNRAVVPVGPVV
jgi:hypothetical protein